MDGRSDQKPTYVEHVEEFSISSKISLFVILDKLHLLPPQIMQQIPEQKANSIILKKDDGEIQMLGSPEGYYLKVLPASQSVTISGKSSAGVFYGVQSLLSLVEGPDGSNLTEMIVYDEPRYPYRLGKIFNFEIFSFQSVAWFLPRGYTQQIRHSLLQMCGLLAL